MKTFYLFPITFLFLAKFSFSQCMMVEVPLNQRVEKATIIFEGKVVDKKSFWNPAHTLIYTSHLIEVYKVFKGNISSFQVELINEGGTVGNDMLVITPNLKLAVEDVGVFIAEAENSLPGAFFYSNEENPTKGKKASISKSFPKYKIYASAQGFLKYNLYANNAADPFKKYNDIKNDIYNTLAQYTKQSYKEIKAIDIYQVNNSESRVSHSINSFTPTTITAGTFDTITIDGSGFGASQGTSTVAFSNADDGGSTIVSTGFASDYVSWSNTQIKAIVHDQAGTGSVYVIVSGVQASKSGLTIPYAQTIISGSGNPYEPNLIDTLSGGYIFRYSTNTANSGVNFNTSDSAKVRFESALSNWKCNTGFNVTASGTTTLGAPAARNGVSVVTFDNSANALAAGVLGTGYSFYSGCDGTNWYVNEIDITFKRDGTGGVTWYFGYDPSSQPGSSTDFESVALHEIGHTHQMQHVINTNNTLHYVLTTGTNRRTLLSDNTDCGDYILAHSTTFNACSRTGMDIYDCALPPVANFTASGPGTCGTPQAFNFTDQSTNGPTSWNWDFGDGGNSTSQNPSHNYSSNGYYTVVLTATNANGSDSDTDYVVISNAPATACTPTSTYSGNYGQTISNVTFNTINNSTSTLTNVAYTNSACSINTVVQEGGTYNLSVSVSADGDNGAEVFEAYIDYNNDGDFSDAGELVFSGSTPTNTIGNFNQDITIPCTATTGTLLRMRVMGDVDYIDANSRTCSASYFVGDVEDYGIYIDAVTTAAAGNNQSVCSSTATLSGNTPTVGTGAWSLISGTATITDASSPTSGLTGLGVGANTLRWTITNGSCTSTNDVIITRDDVPTTANAGNDQTVCGTATMAGNAPSVGTGNWTLVSGTGTITTPSSATTGITGLGVGANTFRWTISNGTCTASNDTVMITSTAAATITWDGSVSTDWNTAGNWDLGYVPSTCSDVIIPFVTNQPTLSTAGYCNTIDIQTTSGAVLTISGSGVLNITN